MLWIKDGIMMRQQLLLKKLLTMVLFAATLLLSTSCSHDDVQTLNADSGNTEESREDDLPGDERNPPNGKTYLVDIAGEMERISVNNFGVEADSNSINSDVSADGRFIVFNSLATNLVNDDSNQTWDIFRRDRLTGQTKRISISQAGEQANAASLESVINSDGRYIAFSSVASNLIDSDTNGAKDVFLVDNDSGLVQRISVSADGIEADADSESPAISADGRYIVYVSAASNLVANELDSGVKQIYWRDRLSGDTRLISIGVDGGAGNADSLHPSISDDGQVVAFESAASNLVANDSNGYSDIFLYRIAEDSIARVNLSNKGEQANEVSVTPKVSGNGLFVVFASNANNLIDNDSNEFRDVFVVDVAENMIERINVNNNGEQTNGSVFASPALSGDGRFVVYYGAATNLVENDNNAAWDVFLYDRQHQRTELVSKNEMGDFGNGSSFEPTVTSDGHYVVFGSQANNFVADDNNGAWDIFLRVLVSSNQPPIADAGMDQQIYLGQSVQLDGTNSIDPDAINQEGVAALSYNWTVLSAPEGSTATIVAANNVATEFMPDRLGEYLLVLEVTDEQGANDSSEVVITVVENLAPEAIINVDQINGIAPLSVIFNAAASSDPEGDNISFAWDFDDAGSSFNEATGAEVVHRFDVPGVYHVLLTATDDYGNTDKATVDIIVEAANTPASVDISADISQGGAPLLVQFYANAVDPDSDALMFHWDFDDGSHSAEENPKHIFTEPGNYNVTLTVSDGQWQSQDSTTIIVNSALILTTKYAVIHYSENSDRFGKVRFKADLDIDSGFLPAIGDTIKLSVDGISIAEIAFELFTPSEINPRVYRFKNNDIRIILDLTKGKIYAKARHLMLHDIKPNNGVDIVLALGSAIATQNLTMRQRTWCRHDRNNERLNGYAAGYTKGSDGCGENSKQGVVLFYKAYCSKTVEEMAH
ncbi:PKD domain-containing protein [Kaarinaea lacus]